MRWRCWKRSTSAAISALGVDGLAAALLHVGRGHLLQVVDVVDKDAVQLVHLRVHVAGHGNVDEKHGAVAAAVQEGLPVLGAEDGVRRAGGADDDVGAAGGLVKLVEWNHLRITALKLLGHAARALLGAVGDQDGARLPAAPGAARPVRSSCRRPPGRPCGPCSEPKILRAISTATEAMET